MRLPFTARALNKDRPIRRLNASQPMTPDMRLVIYGRVHGMNYPTMMDRLLGR